MSVEARRSGRHVLNYLSKTSILIDWDRRRSIHVEQLCTDVVDGFNIIGTRNETMYKTCCGVSTVSIGIGKSDRRE